jgi:hypothetical protein
MISMCMSFLTFLLSLHASHGTCPNECSGHGICSGHTCQCSSSHKGGDCSLHICPMGIPFATKPASSSLRSNAIECSGNGLCDRVIGACACHEAFTGLNCERLLCPSNCNSRGRCINMARASYELGAAAFAPSASYTNWEGGHHFMCVCDGGFSGITPHL